MSTKPAESFSVLSSQSYQDMFLHSFWESSFNSRMLLQSTLAQQQRCARLNVYQLAALKATDIWKSYSIPISVEIGLMKALVWPSATYGCESWTLRKNEETRLDAFETKELRKILRASWTAKKTNEWIVNKAGVKRELLDTVKARKLAYYGHTMRKQGSCLEKVIMQGTMSCARRRGKPRTVWMDNIKTWTGLSVEESIRMTEDRDKWRKYVHSVANPRIEDG